MKSQLKSPLSFASPSQKWNIFLVICIDSSWKNNSRINSSSIFANLSSPVSYQMTMSRKRFFSNWSRRKNKKKRLKRLNRSSSTSTWNHMSTKSVRVENQSWQPLPKWQKSFISLQQLSSWSRQVQGLEQFQSKTILIKRSAFRLMFINKSPCILCSICYWTGLKYRWPRSMGR